MIYCNAMFWSLIIAFKCPYVHEYCGWLHHLATGAGFLNYPQYSLMEVGDPKGAGWFMSLKIRS